MKGVKQFLFITFLVWSVGAAGGTEVYAQNWGNRVTAIAERESNDRFTVVTRTVKGANIYAVNQPAPAMLAAIDKGLDDLFAIAGKYKYRARMRHSDYTIYIARSDRQRDITGNYSPDMAINAGQYSGTEYDKGGYIYVAGLVIAYNPCAFIIAEHTKNLARVSEVVRYEGEHLILYHNDRRRYRQTADHSQGGGHPILQ